MTYDRLHSSYITSLKASSSRQIPGESGNNENEINEKMTPRLSMILLRKEYIWSKIVAPTG